MSRSRNDCFDQCIIKVSPEQKKATLFSDQEMENLMVKINDPRKKERALFQQYCYKYKQFRYTILETAELLGISVKMLKALQNQGEIRCTTSGGKVRFYAGDIRRFLQNCIKRQEK